MESLEWKNKISSHRQIGGIETSVLDNGMSKGVRIAWVDTGSGLRYKVVLDRGMDIVEAFYNNHSLSWLSSVGITTPNASLQTDEDWLRGFAGGLMTSCGLDHVGPGEVDAFGSRSLHGRISHIPADVQLVKQPDIYKDDREMSIIGRMTQTQLMGAKLELKRTIMSSLGESRITVHDEVRNVGNTAAPHMLLYHMNFGYPLVNVGSYILWKGKWRNRDGQQNNPPVSYGDPQMCPDILEAHKGGGEEALFIDPVADQEGRCIAGILNEELQLSVFIHFKKEQLPCLTNWLHWGEGEYVTGLEPGTHYPVGQSAARENGNLILLEPHGKKKYELVIEVVQGAEEIKNFITKNNINKAYGY